MCGRVVGVRAHAPRQEYAALLSSIEQDAQQQRELEQEAEAKAQAAAAAADAAYALGLGGLTKGYRASERGGGV